MQQYTSHVNIKKKWKIIYYSRIKKNCNYQFNFSFLLRVYNYACCDWIWIAYFVPQVLSTIFMCIIFLQQIVLKKQMMWILTTQLPPPPAKAWTWRIISEFNPFFSFKNSIYQPWIPWMWKKIFNKAKFEIVNHILGLKSFPCHFFKNRFPKHEHVNESFPQSRNEFDTYF